VLPRTTNEISISQTGFQLHPERRSKEFHIGHDRRFVYFTIKYLMQTNALSLLCLTAFLLLASCNDGRDKSAGKDSQDSTGQASSSGEDVPKKTGDVRATMNVTITGGDMNGTYSASCRDACCSWGIAGENVFGNQFSETGKGARELSSVQLIVDDVTGNKSSSEFTLTVSFGELFSASGKSFNIDTRKGKKEETGQVDLQYSGEKATVSIKGVSKEGPAIDLKMECNKVMTMNNLMDQ
jgi:hypothetical protein